MVQTVALRIAAEAAAEKREHDPARAVLAMSCQRQSVDRAERACRRAARIGLCQRAEDDPDDAQDCFRVTTDWLRRA